MIFKYYNIILTIYNTFNQILYNNYYINKEPEDQFLCFQQSVKIFRIQLK